MIEVRANAIVARVLIDSMLRTVSFTAGEVKHEEMSLAEKSDGDVLNPIRIV